MIRSVLWAVVLSSWAAAAPGWSESERPRNATATQGMVSSAHPEATAAGVRVLESGGNAFDAAVAVAATLGVVEPMNSGIGGYGTILTYSARDKRVRFLNSSGRIPVGVDSDAFRAPTPGFEANRRGAKAVSTPGNVAAWAALSREYGSADWSSLFRDAVRLADRGFPISSKTAEVIKTAFGSFSAEARGFYGQGGQPRPAGAMLVQRDLARSLTLIARDGDRAINDGPLGAAIDATMREAGGFLRAADLRANVAEWSDAISIDYRGARVYTAPPPANAFDYLVRLGLMAQFDVRGLGHNSAPYLHRFAEATKHAFGLRLRYAGDPEISPPPLHLLLSPAYWIEQARALPLDRASRFKAPAASSESSENTTHFVVADAAGNIVSATQTLGNLFGSRIMPAGTGIWLNNSLAYSTFEPKGNPMDAHPGRRKLSGDCPTIIFRDGRPFAALGTPGGHTIGQTVPQMVMNLIDFNMSIDAAIDAPRVSFIEPNQLAVEEDVPPIVRSALEGLGHDVVIRQLGNAHGLVIEYADDGRLKRFVGAADRRGEGTAGGPTAPFTNINPSWSPDERQIVFESRRHGRAQLYIVNADGTGERRLTWTKGDETHPAWSPDGSRIVFDSTRDGNTWNLFEIRPDGTGLRRLTYPEGGAGNQTARHPQWSPDGRFIVFDSNRDGDDEIYMIAADGAPATGWRLTTSPGQDGHPAFTPDGRILFGSVRSGNEDVWVMDQDGANARPLTDHPSPERAGRMSPDGRWLLFNTERDGNGELYVADMGTGALRNLTRHPDTVFEASWSPSGKRIAFYSDRTGRFEIYTMAADGGDVRQMTSAPYENAFPSWLPDGRIAYSSTQAGGDWEIFLVDPQGGEPLRLTQSPGRDAHVQAWTEGRLLFQSPRAWPQPPNVDIFAMGADGSRVRRLTRGGGFNGVPVPSPDGSRIAFMRGRPRGQGFHWQIHVMDADGGNERAVTSGSWSSQVPTWARDGQALFIHADPEGRDQIYRVVLATGRVEGVHKSSGNDHAPALAADGVRLAFTSDRDNAPGRHDLYLLDLSTGDLRRLTHGFNVRSQPGWSPDSMTLTIAAAPSGVSEIWVVPVSGGEPRRVTRGTEGHRPW